MAITLAGSAFAEIGGGYRVLLALFGCQGNARRVEQLRGHRAPAGQDVPLPAAEVPGHLAAVAVGIFASGKEGQHLVFRRHAEPEDDAGVAIVGCHPIVTRTERRRGADLGPLLALA